MTIVYERDFSKLITTYLWEAKHRFNDWTIHIWPTRRRQWRHWRRRLWLTHIFPRPMSCILFIYLFSIRTKNVTKMKQHFILWFGAAYFIVYFSVPRNTIFDEITHFHKRTEAPVTWNINDETLRIFSCLLTRVYSSSLHIISRHFCTPCRVFSYQAICSIIHSASLRPFVLPHQTNCNTVCKKNIMFCFLFTNETNIYFFIYPIIWKKK